LALFKIKIQLNANFPPEGTNERRIKIYVNCRMEEGDRSFYHFPEIEIDPF